jgi:multidrug efflux pump subunit AcrB
MIQWAVNRPAVIWATSVALLLAGAMAFTRLALATRTTVELPRLQVSAAWPVACEEIPAKPHILHCAGMDFMTRLNQ